ncbi:MAG TPA: hypothetical protein VFI24_02025 [Pyrinomonadaceae bacterium]|nr:hypothetical protein [Pyrinomonadaceae bacterium]
MPRLLRAELDGTELAVRFDRIYEESLKIWDEQHMRQFTAHGKLHTRQVEKNLDALTRPLQLSQNRLTPDEIFVLLSAACLHDIGMQLIDDPDARRKHAEYSHNLILDSAPDGAPAAGRVILPINDRNSRIAIAKIARAHWTEHALKLDSIDFINDENDDGRLKLLGLLLAMADLLDLSPVRARYFRTIHRLYGLSPESELHQTMHNHVRGIRIRPPNKDIPGALQFQVQWNGDEALVREMNEWVMDWFDSQWRQLRVPLFEESGGIIQWARTWRKESFRPRENLVLDLSQKACNILKAERTAQLRIDRKYFGDRFLQALKNKEALLFLAPVHSDFDRHMRDWCMTHARLHEECKVVYVQYIPQVPDDAESLVPEIIAQLEIPINDGSDYLQILASVLKQEHGPSLVSIVKTDEPVSESLKEVIKTLLLRSNDSSARICLLICPQAKCPHDVGDISIVKFDGLPLSRNDIEEHLQKRGFSDTEIQEIYELMGPSDPPAQPDHVYTFVGKYCAHNTGTLLTNDVEHHC